MIKKIQNKAWSIYCWLAKYILGNIALPFVYIIGGLIMLIVNVSKFVLYHGSVIFLALLKPMCEPSIWLFAQIKAKAGQIQLDKIKKSIEKIGK